MPTRRRTLLLAIFVIVACFAFGAMLTPTTTTTSPPQRAPQGFVNPATETLLGVPWSFDGLGRMILKDYSTVDQLWVSTETGTLTGIQAGLIGCQQLWNPNPDEDSCYSAGSGGTIRVDIYADDGTAAHLPTGPSLGWVQWVDPMSQGTWWSVEKRNYNGYSEPLMFSGCVAPRRMSGASLNVTGTVTAAAAGTMTCSGSPISVTRGTRYHTVWTNPNPAASTNWWGLNHLTTRAKKFAIGASQQTAVLPADQWDVRYKATAGRYDTGGTYRSCTLQGGEFQGNGLSDGFPGNHCYHASFFFSPQLAMLYGSGNSSGAGYESLSGGDATNPALCCSRGAVSVNATRNWRQSVYPAVSTTVSGITAQVAVLTAGTMTAWLTNSAGATVATATSRSIALAPPLRPLNERDGLVCNPFPSPPPNNCTSNSYSVTLPFPSDVTLSPGTYNIMFGATGVAEYALIGGYHISGFPEGTKAKRSSPTVSSSNIGDWDLFTYLVPSGVTIPTTTTPATTTTIAGAGFATASAAGDPAGCAGGTRYQAEAMTKFGGSITTDAGGKFVTWTLGNPSSLFWTLPPPTGTDWVWRIRYSAATTNVVGPAGQQWAARRLPFHNNTYVPEILFTTTAANTFSTIDVPMTAELSTFGYLFWDDSDFGSIDALDYVDVCPAPYTVAGATTTTTIAGATSRVVTLAAFVDANSDGDRQAKELQMRRTRWRLFNPAGKQMAGGVLDTPSGTLTVPVASGWTIRWYPPLPATTATLFTIPPTGAATIRVGGCCLGISG
jgi:hypothetical protein